MRSSPNLTTMPLLNRETKTLLYFSVFSTVLLLARIAYTERITYLFLLWNLFLAAVPYVLVQGMSNDTSKFVYRLYNLLVIVVWMLFFPNAPYIFTDLFHLRSMSSSIIWYDTTMILSIAWTGMLFGYLSLLRIEKHLASFLSPLWSRLSVYALLFVSAFGVYIGRYLRFNSWDVLSDPFGLMYEVGHHVVNPFTHPRTWGMTLVFGLFLSLIYSSLHLIRQQR